MRGDEGSPLDRRLFLATRREDLGQRGWDKLDVLLVTGDAYVDHPSFPASLLGRILEGAGYRVGVVARCDVSSPADVARLGAPRLFCGVTSGALDSMVANYTALRKPRSDDPYAADGKAGGRPDRAVTVYCNLLRRAFGKRVPIVIGGIEASLRRYAHYDYWSNRVRRSILIDSGADILLAGTAEEAVLLLARRMESLPANWAGDAEILAGHVWGVPGVMVKGGGTETATGVTMPSADEVAAEGRAHVAAFNLQSRQQEGALVQRQGALWVCGSPPAVSSRAALDAAMELPFLRTMHPDYRGLRAPALEQVQFSVTTHRGCFGGCAFCAITGLQGKGVVSRSEASVMTEVKGFVRHPDFRGTIPDLGGPTANMWQLGCTADRLCQRPSCLHPTVCCHLNTDQSRYRELLTHVAELPGVRHLFVTTGIRMDLALGSPELLHQLAFQHTSGHLKVAPEHVVDEVLRHMRKPSGSEFSRFVALHRGLSAKAGKRQSVIPYLMAAHPGCTLNDMVDAAVALASMGITVEQCQIFTPTPGTASTVMYATGINPDTLEPVFVERSDRGKQMQKSLLLYHLPSQRAHVMSALTTAKREEAARQLWSQLPVSRKQRDSKNRK